MTQQEQAYAEGFVNKCAESNVDPEALVKLAGPQALKWLASRGVGVLHDAKLTSDFYPMVRRLNLANPADVEHGLARMQHVAGTPSSHWSADPAKRNSLALMMRVDRRSAKTNPWDPRNKSALVYR